MPSCSISPSGVVACQAPFSRFDIADAVVAFGFLLGEGITLHLEQAVGDQSLAAHILQGFAAGAIAACSWQTRQRLRRFLDDASTYDDQAVDIDVMERGEGTGIPADEHAPAPLAELEPVARIPSPARVTDDPFDYVPLMAKPIAEPPLSTPMAQPDCQRSLISL